MAPRQQGSGKEQIGLTAPLQLRRLQRLNAQVMVLVQSRYQRQIQILNTQDLSLIIMKPCLSSVIYGEKSKEDRPNDISELNRAANEERCSIEPDESAASDGSSLTENCYFDIQGRDELAEFIAGGTCVTASGGAHFDYDSSNPGRCTQNRFFILDRGLILNGSSGLSAAELCEEDLACDPADF